MKKCKLHSTAINLEVEAVIVDNKVLVPVNNDSETRYVSPAEALALPRGAYVRLLPFSVECEWGEFGECLKLYLYFDYDEEDPRPSWAIDSEIDDIPEKWGFCDIYTGEIRIAPQWERCEDFNDDDLARVKGGGYGVINTSGMLIIMPEYSDLIFAPDETVLIKNDEGFWGAYCPSDWDEFPAVELGWDGIWYDGGAYTVKKDNKYLLLNAREGTPLIDGLTEKPERYDCRRENSYRNLHPENDFRILERNGRLGLARDIETGESEILLEPEYGYEYVLEAAYKAEQEVEIRYYAWMISQIPEGIASRHADCWETVPKDIRNEVWKQAKAWAEGII